MMSLHLYTLHIVDCSDLSVSGFLRKECFPLSLIFLLFRRSYVASLHGTCRVAWSGPLPTLSRLPFTSLMTTEASTGFTGLAF